MDAAPWIAATALLVSACTAAPPNDCVWVQRIVPSDGFEQRWTREEKRQVLTHNELVDRFCRK